MRVLIRMKPNVKRMITCANHVYHMRFPHMCTCVAFGAFAVLFWIHHLVQSIICDLINRFLYAGLTQ